MTLRICLDMHRFTMADVAQRVEAFLRDGSCHDEFVFAIHLVVEELIANVKNHGDATEVELELELTPDQLVVDIADSGQAFDPLQFEVQGLDDDFGERQIGGMGIYLVKEMMDEVFYQYENGKNRLRAVKNRSSQ